MALKQLHGKRPYDPHATYLRAAEHASNFMFNRERQVEHLHDRMGRNPIVVAPYDAELFGHWWYEGPTFLELLFRKHQHDQDVIAPITPSGYLVENPTNQVATPCASSLGYKGYSEFCCDGSNAWLYRYLHKIGERMVELAHRFPHPSELQRRALNQAARELMLAQSSDWAFIMKTGTTVPYATKRTVDHASRFNPTGSTIRWSETPGWMLRSSPRQSGVTTCSPTSTTASTRRSWPAPTRPAPRRWVGAFDDDDRARPRLRRNRSRRREETSTTSSRENPSNR